MSWPKTLNLINLNMSVGSYCAVSFFGEIISLLVGRSFYISCMPNYSYSAIRNPTETHMRGRKKISSLLKAILLNSYME